MIVICTKTVIYPFDNTISLEKSKLYELSINKETYIFNCISKETKGASACWYRLNDIKTLPPPGDIRDYFMSIEEWRDNQIDKIL